MRANETYSEANRQFSDRNMDVLMNVQSPHKWWSTLKSAVFGSSSSLPPHVSEGGGLLCESVGTADLLSDHFDSKQSMEAVDLPLTCHPSPSFTTFAVRYREVRRLLLDLVLYLCRMCQCGLHAVLWSHIDTLTHRLAAEPCSTA